MQPRAPTHDVTQLLQAWGHGDQAALDRLMPLVYEDLRRIAKRNMARERPGHTLQTTALVNEVYLRLVDERKVSWQDRAHFFAICARTMRRILVDFARSRHYRKRGGKAVSVTLDDALGVSPDPAVDLLALNDALKGLAKL